MESLPSFRGVTPTSPKFNAVQRDYKDYSAGNVWTTTRSSTASPTPSLYGDRNRYNVGGPNQYDTNSPSLDYVAGSAANPRDDYGFRASSRANSPSSSYTRAGFPPPPQRQQRRPSLPVLDPYSDLVSSCASQPDIDITSYEDELEPDQSVRGGKQYRDPTSKKMKDLNRQDSVDGGSGGSAASAAALLNRSRTPQPESPPSDEDGSDPDQQPTLRQRYWPPPQGFAPSPLQKQERQGSEQRDTNTTGSPSFDTSIEDGSVVERGQPESEPRVQEDGRSESTG